tara:strand:- start:239 stop:391 length:153 start_codon:yes stop_codon:yes gene_type:complete
MEKLDLLLFFEMNGTYRRYRFGMGANYPTLPRLALVAIGATTGVIHESDR